MHGVMKGKGINVGKTKIGRIMGEINPEAQAKRQNVAGHSLNPKVYIKYFDDKIHYDQNEKLRMFGVAHVCAGDVFSGKIGRHAIDCNVSTFLRVRVLQKDDSFKILLKVIV